MFRFNQYIPELEGFFNKWELFGERSGEWNNVINCSEKCRRDKSIEWSIGFSHKESK